MAEREIEKFYENDGLLVNEISINKLVDNYYQDLCDSCDEHYFMKNIECKIIIDLINLFKRGYEDYIENYFLERDYLECVLMSFGDYVEEFLDMNNKGLYTEINLFCEKYVFNKD